MPRTLSRETISTKQRKIATLARQTPTQVLTTLAHLIDVGWLQEAYRRTRKRSAAGVDGVTAAYQYETALEANLTSLLERLWRGLMDIGGGWVVDLDIQHFFDSVDRAQLGRVLDQRVRDGVIRRAIGKWLRAGVMEDGRVWYPEQGTPQGGVITPRTQKVTSIVCGAVGVVPRRAGPMRRAGWNGDAVADHDRVSADEHLLDDQRYDPLSLPDVQRVGRPAAPE